MDPMRFAVACSTFVVTTALVPIARAAPPTDDVVTIGFSMSVKLCCAQGGAVGFGPALNYAHWLSNERTTVGGFGWLQYYPAYDSTRIGVGPQASQLFGGVELGPSVLFGHEPTAVAASITPFGSIGFIWAGVRLNLGARQSALLEFVTGGGYPIGFERLRVVQSATGSGRPLRIAGEAYACETCDDPSFAPAISVTIPHRASDRAARAARWRRDAELETASVLAFENLARDLAELGAPVALIEGCTRAARDERKHSRMCYALASAYAGRALGPVAVDAARLTSPNLAALVRESVLDGCLGEGIAAALARDEMRSEPDPAVRKVLRAIARDEARHAGLAWQIVEWARDLVSLDEALCALERQTFDDERARVVHRRVSRRLRRLIGSPIRVKEWRPRRHTHRESRTEHRFAS